MEKCASQHMSSSSSSDSRWNVDCIEPHSPSPPILAIPSGPCMVAPEPPLLGELPGSIEPRADLSVPRMPGSRGIGQASAVSQHLARVESASHYPPLMSRLTSATARAADWLGDSLARPTGGAAN